MAGRPNQVSVHVEYGGGWATDFRDISEVAPDASRTMRVPFVTDASNTLFTLDGGVRKMPGTAKLNGAALESGAVVKGLFDYWQGNATQHRIIHVGTKIKKDDADGAFTDLFTGLTSDAIPCYMQFDDIAIMGSSVDAPRSWDGTTAQLLAGTPPSFTCCAVHQNRAWGGKDSTLSYSALLDPEDWVGAGSGSISIDPDDGDEIKAIASHRNELWVFKGAHKGSIHRITGTSPSDFARKTFQEGTGAAGPNCLFKFGNDLGYIRFDGLITSLSATERFGDFDIGTLTNGINDEFLQPRLVFNRLDHAWAATDPANSLVLVGVPIDTVQNLNFHLAIDFRFAPPRLSPLYDLPTGGCIASVIDPGASNRRILMLGGADGFVRKWNQTARSIDGTGAYAANVATPFLNFGTPFTEKTISHTSIPVRPRGSGDVTFKWQRDDNAAQTVTFSQGGGVKLGEFLLGTDTLAASTEIQRFSALGEEGGQFRQIKFTLNQPAANEDMDVRGMHHLVEFGGLAMD